MDKDFNAGNEQLRKQAEALLADTSRPVEDLPPEKVRELIHDYQVNQIELELQNEELRNAQRQLESVKERYAELFNIAPAGYLIIDQAGVIFQTNKTFAAMIGLEPHHLIGKPLADLMVSTDRSAFYGRFKSFFNNPEKKHLDFRLNAKAGELEVRCTGRVENIHYGQQEKQTVRHLLLVLNDRSSQARFERRQQLVARILAILNNSQDLANGINLILESIQQETGIDACGIRLRKGDDFPYYAHHGFSKDFLHQENTLLARDSHGDVCRNSAGEPALECTCGLVLTGQTDPSNPLFTPNGSCWTNDSFPLLELPGNQDPRLHPRNTCIHQGYQSVALVPVRANLEIVGLLQLNDHRKDFFDLDLIHFLEKISDSIGIALMRLQDTQQIKESEERFRSIVEGAPDAVFVQTDLKFAYLNQAALALFGAHSQSELLRQSVMDRSPEEFREQVQKRTRLLNEQKQAVPNLEQVYLRLDATRVPVEVSAVPITYQGEDGALVFVREISERKRAEAEIRNKTEQLQHLLAEKDKLFTIIAHDLKSPMSGLVGSTQMLAMEPELFSEQDFRFLAKEMHKNAVNTFELLEDLLQWSRMSQGGIDYAPTSSSLNDLMTMGLSTGQDMARAKDITIRKDFPQGLTVLVDQPMLKTVIRNVLFNAIKFTHRGGEIVIRARQEGRTVRVSIQDNGIGMKEHVLSTLFTLDKEKRQLGTEGEKGTGLGLVLCKQFIEQHGGEIRAESVLGKGTTVCFTLPAK
ncbi:PAS domain S-box-containing protein [Desulfonatronum zhilinae]|nr:PAS domain S-box-containing protein [Desulfonatronum zhilinae]